MVLKCVLLDDIEIVFPFPKSELNESREGWLFSKATFVKVTTTCVFVITSSEVISTIEVSS